MNTNTLIRRDDVDVADCAVYYGHSWHAPLPPAHQARNDRQDRTEIDRG